MPTRRVSPGIEDLDTKENHACGLMNWIGLIFVQEIEMLLLRERTTVREHLQIRLDLGSNSNHILNLILIQA